MPANNTTTNYNFNLTDFDKIPWHTEEHNNWHIIDALLARYIAIGSVEGAWENALAVTVGSRYIDTDTDTIWEVLVAHTTASTGTFAASRTANSSYWKSISVDVSARGTYAQNTAYNPNDFVIQGDRYGVVQTTYTSDNTQATVILSYDLDVTNGNIVTLIDGSDLFDIIFSSTGIMTKTATGTFASREIEGGTGIDLTNGTGISGNPSVAIDSTVATLTGSQTLTNKVLTAPTINGVVGGTQTSATITTLTTTNVDGILGANTPAAATTTNLTVNGNTTLGDATPRTFINRKTDTRNLGDTIYKMRYVIPAGTGITSARPPIDAFVMQESNSTTGASDTEVSYYYSPDTVSLSNVNEVRNFRFIADASWDGTYALYRTELPHKLSVGAEVEVLNIVSTENTAGLTSTGYNGTFRVVGISSANNFKVSLSDDPGTFNLAQTVSRTTSLPRFARKQYKDTLYIYRSQEIQEYKSGDQDGIYHLTVLSQGLVFYPMYLFPVQLIL